MSSKQLNKQVSTYKNNCKNFAREWALSKIQAFNIMLDDCHYCGCEKAMGIDRVDNNIGYTTANSVPCCLFCNRAKGQASTEDFLTKINAIARRYPRDISKKPPHLGTWTRKKANKLA